MTLNPNKQTNKQALNRILFNIFIPHAVRRQETVKTRLSITFQDINVNIIFPPGNVTKSEWNELKGSSHA
jgi:hypothetical protein